MTIEEKIRFYRERLDLFDDGMEKYKFLIDQAKNSYAKCIFLMHGRAWDPKGWFWSPALDCAKRGKRLIK